MALVELDLQNQNTGRTGMLSFNFPKSTGGDTSMRMPSAATPGKKAPKLHPPELLGNIGGSFAEPKLIII